MENFNNIKTGSSTSLPTYRTKTNFMQTTSHYKHDYPILEYQEKFKSNYQLMKESLQNINANITNYKNEIYKLEDFLITINDHEINFKMLLKKFNNLKKILEESIEIENLISKLSTNQQIINISEYVNLYGRVREIINFFNNISLSDKDDFISNMKKLMFRGFKVYEESFYVILKRYDQLESTRSNENEKLNLLNKVRLLAECLQDELFSFDFTTKLITERSDKICEHLDSIKINLSKNLNEDNYEKNCGMVTNLLIESEKIFCIEREYVLKILETCPQQLKDMVYSNIIEAPLEKIELNLKEIVNKHNKSNIKNNDFYQNLDILNIWHEKINKAYKNLIENFNKGMFSNISNLIKMIEIFCFNYVGNFIKEINIFNEKIENENVLKICSDTVFFLTNLLMFEISYEYIKKEFEGSGKEFSAEIIIDNLIKKMEAKSTLLDKKYPPLKFIFLINNIYFIRSKIINKPFANYISKSYADVLNNKIKNYIDGYLIASWGKADEITFNEKDNLNSITFDQDGKTLKNSSKELLKKKFATFNDTMKINLKFQQHIQIIDNSLEKMLINANVEYIAQRYQDFYDKYNTLGFTKFRNKYLLYSSSNDVIQDLKLYFMPHSNKVK